MRIQFASLPLKQQPDVRDVKDSCVSAHREEVEKDMHFLGLLMMKNLVKPESPRVIKVMRLANLRSVMVTGEGYLMAAFPLF